MYMHLYDLMTWRQRNYMETKKLIFLWNGNTNKIYDGGLKMIDFESKIKALKLTWIKRAYKLMEINN